MSREDDDLLDRCWCLVEKEADAMRVFPMMYSAGNSGVENYGRRQYVVLRNTSDVLYVFLVEDPENPEMLDPKDWPEDLAEAI